MVDDFVSIVLPVRDGEKTLARCLEALVRTDYPADRREIVVVDNVSSDRTPEIARSFPVTLVSELREGLSHARNRGVEVSVGELIVFLDVDCFVTTNWLRKLVDCLRSAPVDAVTGEVIAFPPSTPAQKYFPRRKPRARISARAGSGGSCSRMRSFAAAPSRRWEVSTLRSLVWVPRTSISAGASTKPGWLTRTAPARLSFTSIAKRCNDLTVD